MSYSIAIDGPAGAGKSTIAKNLAKKLGYIYIDTGAMYRAMGVYFLRKGISSENEEEIKNVCEEVDIRISYVDGEQQVILNEENITSLLRTEEVGKMASATSVYPVVRLKLVELQRQLAKKENVIMDGRDIGSYVLPDADIKIYLTASSDARAKRRYMELCEKGAEYNLETIKADIEERDFRDMNRDFAPLKKAEDAITVDSSELTIKDVTDTILRICENIIRS
ncbi:MAG: (d)CMP kinase [Clostridiales bacterium]|nr:(d)CMP kinase [Clostridiales bacterium]